MNTIFRSFESVGVIVAIILPVLYLIEYFQSKVLADFQARVGPNRSGFAGLVQPLNDSVKLWIKGKTLSGSISSSFWFFISVCLIFSTVGFLPFPWATGESILGFDALVLLVIIFGSQFSRFLLAVERRDEMAWMDGVREISQVISGIFLSILCLLIPAFISGGFSWSDFIEVQGSSPLRWMIFKSPFAFFSFFMFLVSGLYLLGIAPFNPHSQKGLGFSGIELWLYGFTKRYGLFLWCIVTTTIYLGGYRAPPVLVDFFDNRGLYYLANGVQVAVLFLKSFFLVLLIRWTGSAHPHFQAEQSTKIAWKYFIPLASLLLVAETVWSGGSLL